MAVLTHWDGEPVGVWARVWRADVVEAHDVVGSTNDRLRELAALGAGPFSVVVAEEQTAGRGRAGSSWHSPPGAGLWISTLLPSEEPVMPYLPLLVGLAAARAAERACPGVRVGIKWPNDLEIGGRKTGGILCEHGHGAVVAGIGLNVRLPAAGLPAELAARATSLESSAPGRVSLGTLATALLHELREIVPHRPCPLSPALHEELERRDVLRDRPVMTERAGEGTARGIAADGALWVERPDRERVRVVAGSVRRL
ncbi:MAG: biotin--[acetyl-CoA-carboxylase] ligase [Longimicrobiales bacterium]|nr:biotin--[acetyl-CoA-carboxylase] ligase [Longimicrobiales bacterium]